ncbi:MAG: DNA polymerase III subunit alpha [Candidatus Poribacteria bacterium]
MNKIEFVHLHNHSEYSFLDGACRIDDMIDWASETGAPAIAITDHGGMFGVLDFYKAAKKKSVKPIFGCEVYFTDKRHNRDAKSKREAANHLVLLAENETGYKNLIKLISFGYTEGFHYVPRIDTELLSEYNEGLIALTACIKGRVPSLIGENRYKEAKEHLCQLAEIMGKNNLYLELGLHGIDEEFAIMPRMMDLSEETGIPAVATNDCHYVRQENARAHEVLLAIQTNKTLNDENRMKFTTNEFYFKSPREMRELFKDYPESVIRNSVEIADRCEIIELSSKENIMPRFELEAGQTADEVLERRCQEGLRKRYPEITPEIRKRLEHELNIIKQMGYSGYFLIVLDYVQFAREKGFSFTARGSGGGSLVLYLLGITNFDPMKYDLLFERFLNPERISMPDIDMDFEPEHRDVVMDYVIKKYGSDSVAHVAAFSTLGARSAIRRVGKTLDLPLNEVDRIAKLVPAIPNITLDEAMQMSPQLKQIEERGEYAELFKLARALEGITSHITVHASGIVVSNGQLVNNVPLFKDSKNERVATQFDKYMLEDVGMVKFDFLGQKTIAEIRAMIRLIKENRNEDVDLDNISFDDEETYKLIGSGLLAGIFQLETSSGMRNVIMQIKPSNFEEFIAIPSLYRPGPIESGTMDSFIQRKLGLEPIEYPYPELKPLLEPILGKTYGVCIYQEQVMQMAQAIAGFTLGQADLLRRAMSSKKLEDMQRYRELFIQGAAKKGISAEIANKMFDIIEPFAGYGFNKSHGTAYAILSYQMAYLKTHYPVEFMATLMTSESSDSEKIFTYLAECRKMNITVLPPDINQSHAGFTVSGDKIHFGLAAVKNVTEDVVDAIVKARDKSGGKFTSLYDFCERVNLKAVNRRAIESLIKVGAFDSLGGHRAQFLAALDSAMKQANRTKERKAIGQLSLFDSVAEEIPQKQELPDVPQWSDSERLAHEKECLGFYLSGHPLSSYEEIIKYYTTANSRTLSECLYGTEVYMAGMISSIRNTTTKKNDPMAFFTLEDLEGATDAVVWPKYYEQCSETISEDAIVWVRGIVNPGRSRLNNVDDSEEHEEEERQLEVSEILPISEVKDKQTFAVDITIPQGKIDRDTMASLKEICQRHKGEYDLVLHLMTEKHGEVVLQSDNTKVSYNDNFVAQIEAFLGENTAKTSNYTVRPNQKSQRVQYL